VTKQEESLPRSKLLQSTPCHNNHNTHDNKDGCDDGNGINFGGDDGRHVGVHTTTFPITQNNEEVSEVLAAAEVTPHIT
jgi:hypothetical protein